MTMTQTRSKSDTFTDARLAAVLPEVAGDFYGLANASLISFDTASTWTEELGYCLGLQAVSSFQIQFCCAGAPDKALNYVVSADGSLTESGTSGGIDFFSLPKGTRASLFVQFNTYAAKYPDAKRYTTARGWGTDGQAINGDVIRDRAYSKEGFGFVRGKVGSWA